MRHAFALIAGAVVAALGGLIVGEYPFRGWMPFVAGVLFGFVISEVMVSVDGSQSVWLGTAAALFAGAGLAYAVWDDAGYGVRPVEAVAWIGVGVAMAVAGLRGGWWVAIRQRSTVRE